MSGSRTGASPMTADEAMDWLRRVDGELFRTPRGARGAWVAVVRAPRGSQQAARLIVALGESMEEATSTAAPLSRGQLH